MAHQVNIKQFNVKHGNTSEKWEIVYFEVRNDGEVLYLLCVNERDEPQVVRVPVNHLLIVSKSMPDGAWHSVVNHAMAEQQRIEEVTRQVPLQAAVEGPKAHIHITLSDPEQERRVVDWLTGSLAPRNSSTGSSQGTPPLDMSDLHP